MKKILAEVSYTLSCICSGSYDNVSFAESQDNRQSFRYERAGFSGGYGTVWRYGSQQNVWIQTGNADRFYEGQHHPH